MKQIIGNILIISALIISACSPNEEKPAKDGSFPPISGNEGTFPAFITKNSDYFEFSIDDAPQIDELAYKLTVSGMVNKPRSFTLAELRTLPVFERTQTTECIGNEPNGERVSTALWKGFSVMDLLDSLGLKKGAKTVNFICADGYVSSNSIDELRENNALGALYANKEPLPVKMGFPLRILNPGYFGIKNPGWVTEITVTDQDKRDYWRGSEWVIENPMEVDSKIFFPGNVSQWSQGDSIRIGGAAFGSKKVAKVEYSVDGGQSWNPAEIVNTGENDFTWIFWETTIFAKNKGEIQFRSRATDVSGITQPISDNNKWDGTNSCPTIRIIIK